MAKMSLGLSLYPKSPGVLRAALWNETKHWLNENILFTKVYSQVLFSYDKNLIMVIPDPHGPTALQRNPRYSLVKY